MRIKYKRQSKRREVAMDFWLQVVNDYNNGLDAKQIAGKYINPATGRNYTREHIYWVLKQVRKIPASKFKK